MPRMTDPLDGLISFQRAFLNGEIDLQTGALDADLFVHSDQPTPGIQRLTYVRIDQKSTVTALAMIVGSEPIDGIPCFQLGVAIPEQFRGRGYAKNVLTTAIAELKYGLLRNNISSFCVEAVVSIDNEASKRVAEAVISKNPTAITDHVSGLPALHYVRTI